MKKLLNNGVLTVLVIALITLCLSLLPRLSEARVISVQMSAPTIAFGGYSWPRVGQYEKITGVAYAEVDPTDHRNSIIVDIGLAQPQAAPGQPGKTPSGKVAYLLNFYILKPVNLNQVDPSLNGFGKVMYEPPNRGNKTWTALGRVTGGGNDPASITDPTILANSFLMPRGYTLVWSGWEPLVSLASLGTSLTASVALPIAKNPDGSTITGPAYEYIVSSATSFTLSYPAATLDKTKATLTHRVHLDDVPEVIPASGWEYTSASGTAIRLLPAGTPFVANDIYEFSYTAKDPTVAGLGFAAVRDWNSWLRYDTSAANPLANYITRIYTEISSQPGRMFNDFRHLGFNEDDQGAVGRKVFDGHMQWISAGSGIGMNYRFSQSGRTERNRQDHLYPENLFPFANVATTDPFTGKTDSRYARCQATGTCPFGVEIYSGNEYWVKTASLLHTTPDGASDLPDSPYTRNYFMSSMRHGTGNAASRGSCQQFDNPLNSAPVQRALFLALDAWTYGTLPPSSRVPRFADGTLVLPADTGFPTNIPDSFGETANGKVTYTGLKTSRYRFNLGPGFYDTGIPTIFPPVITPPLEPLLADKSVPDSTSPNGPIYPSFVPKTDSDGNDIAGVRLPDVTVPLATYTGWALRRGAQANDGCEAAGQFIPFAATKVDRLASGDPRPSVQERYPTFAEYQSAVHRAIDGLVKDRLLLCEDAGDQLARLNQAGLDAGVPEPRGQGEVKSITPLCLNEKRQ
ncbi:MAG TPA: alpha/beta hydrolase domain-containing protein [Candidatus Binatia bacterium]